ncbi:hypothetical protein QBC35DRAFT_551019 [Podospora australis]|uniref:Uncharacterized protein n=1 Tax=Podospora australis TaxID=1536484 RepID=A0AAN7AJ04_9PEZI|nr:hypothetical protein QBC35DRAFT_551019 [Podospora australis]
MVVFQDLPVEILFPIVESLCHHGGTTDPSEEENVNFNFSGDWEGNIEDRLHANTSTLISLCLTSRLLNAIATPHLYHWPHPRKWWLLARTLIIRKHDLARHVRHLDLFNIAPLVMENTPCPPAVEACYRDRVESLRDRLTSDENTDPHFAKYEKGGLETMDRNLPISFLVTLCPNLESIYATIDCDDFFIFSPPNTMPHLRKVVLSYWDTKYGIIFPWLGGLSRAAPNIESMILTKIVHAHPFDERKFSLEKVRSLDLRETTPMQVDILVRINKILPNLEMSRFHLNGRDLLSTWRIQFSPQQLIDATLLHAQSLQCLDVIIDGV